MIHLSPSSIKDYLTCTKRFYYRYNFSELGIQTEAMAVGNLIHKVIESYWNDSAAGYNSLDKMLVEFNVNPINLKKIRFCLDVFYSSYVGMLTPEDGIEESFKFKHPLDVQITGRFDRRVPNSNILIDWKTGDKVPYTINNDIQFILYHIAYKKLYNKTPVIYMINLPKNKVVSYTHTFRYEDELMNQIIPDIVDNMKEAKSYTRGGYYNNACGNCIFKQACWEEQ